MAAVCVLSGSVRVAEDEVRVFLIDKGRISSLCGC